jgi:ABC-2 type transport system ATP-binding protein
MNRDHGTTIVLTSHDMSDVAALCRRIALIDHGVIGFDGNLTELRERSGQHADADLDQVLAAMFRGRS